MGEAGLRGPKRFYRRGAEDAEGVARLGRAACPYAASWNIENLNHQRGGFGEPALPRDKVKFGREGEADLLFELGLLGEPYRQVGGRGRWKV